MSDRYPFKTPAIDYTAKALDEYARDHGVAPGQEMIFRAMTRAGANIFRHGYALADGPDRQFEVGREIPKTIPLLLARFALYERYTPGSWGGDFSAANGIMNDHCRWLRLINVDLEDERIDEVLDIVGAQRTEEDAIHTELDERGRAIHYTKHFYMETDRYAVRVTQPRVILPNYAELIDIGFCYPEINGSISPGRAT